MLYRLAHTIGGKKRGPFSEKLKGVAVDSRDMLYAVGDRHVHVFDREGKPVRQWNIEKESLSVAVDADGYVYVGQTGQVAKYDGTGRLLGTWSDQDRLGAVTAIGLTGELIFVGDAHGRCVRKYRLVGTASSAAGEKTEVAGTRPVFSQWHWESDIGRNNNTRGFMIPNGVLDFALDGHGVIHVAHAGKHRIERYSTNGALLGHFGRFGTRRPEDFPGCCNPTNIALLPQGRLAVTEKAPPRLKVYNNDGGLAAVVGPEAFDPNCKNMDVAADSRGRLYVTDTERLCIQVFSSEDVGERSADKT